MLPLFAQEPSPEDYQDLQRLLEQPIQSASKRTQRLKEAAADVTVLLGGDLLDLGYGTLGEALGGVLGFRTNEDRAYQGLGVRGLYVLGDQNTRILVLLDGHALNSPAEVGSSKVGQDFGIPLEQIERIEVIRGPASSLYGDNAFLGMVNVITKSAQPGRLSGDAAMTASTRGLLQTDGALSGSAGPVEWKVILSDMRRQGSETTFPELSPRAMPAHLDREQRQSAYLSVKGPDWSLAGYSLNRLQGLPSAPFNSAIGSGLNEYRNHQSFFDGRYTPTIGGLETLFRVFGDRSEYATTLAYDGTRQTLPGAYSESDPNWSLGAEEQARLRMGDDFLFTLGCEESWQHYGGSVDSNGLLIRTQLRHQVMNGYFQGEWRPQESLAISVGLQESAWVISRASIQIASASTTYPASTLRGFTPRYSVVWQPTSLDIVKILYGGGYRNPTVFERYYSDDGSILANPSLAPERIRTLQGIWVHVWGGGIQSQVSATRSVWQNLIQPVPLGDGAQQSQNSTQELKGSSVEAELQGRWAGWSLYGQAGLYRWEQDGQVFPDAAQVQGGFRMTRRWKRLSASVEGRYVGPREVPLVGVRVPGATVWRASMRLEAGRWWVRGALEDIGQAQREDLVAVDYLPIVRMASDGRTFRMTAGVRF